MRGVISFSSVCQKASIQQPLITPIFGQSRENKNCGKGSKSSEASTKSLYYYTYDRRREEWFFLNKLIKEKLWVRLDKNHVHNLES